MHRLTATDTPMVRYTRTIFPSYADSQYENLLNYFILKYKYQTDNDELSYFIVNKVPIIIDNTMGKYKQFFYEELSMLVEQTKRYKDLKTYLDSTSDMLPI